MNPCNPNTTAASGHLEPNHPNEVRPAPGTAAAPTVHNPVMEKPIRWQVWRQDDNGARFLIASYESEDEARTRLDEIERTGGHHKQLYWMSRSDRPRP